MATSRHLLDKYHLILENEQALTTHVAGAAVDKPQLALWMILIPIFFVFYYFQFNRYRNGLKSFKKNFIRDREHVLDAVYDAVDNNEDLDIEGLISTLENPPELARRTYHAWVAELAVFFRSLLTAEGDDYRTLVRSCYNKKSNYLIALNKLNGLEKELNRALLADLSPKDERTVLTIEEIEKGTERFRRAQAKEIFSS